MNLGKKNTVPRFTWQRSHGSLCPQTLFSKSSFQAVIFPLSAVLWPLSCPTASQLDSMPSCVNSSPHPRPCRGHLSRYTVSQGPGGSRQEWHLLAGGGEISNGGPVSMAPILRLPTALHTRSCAWEAARKSQWAFHPPNAFLGLF